MAVLFIILNGANCVSYPCPCLAQPHRQIEVGENLMLCSQSILNLACSGNVICTFVDKNF